MRASYSKISGYAFCPKKYEYRYVRRVPVPTKPELAFGVALHASLERNFLQKIDTHQDLSAPQLQAIFLEELEEALDGVPEENLRGPSDPLYLRSMGQQFLEKFLTERAPRIQPTPRGVESRFHLSLPGGHEVSGQLDLIDTDGVLHDFKTSSKPYDPRKADRTQLVLYAWASEQMFGRWPTALCFDVFVKGDGADGFVGLQEPVMFPVPSPDEMAKVSRVLSSQINVLQEAENRGRFQRSFQPPRCHWCEFQTTCLQEWEWEGRPAPVRVSLESLSF